MGFHAAKDYFKQVGAITPEQKRIALIDFGKKLYSNLGRPLTRNDFRVKGRFTEQTIYRYFRSLNDYFEACGSPLNCKKPRMTDDEFRDFLIKIKEVTPGGCWVTSYYKANDGRITIGYKRKTQLLYRVSYLLFNGPILSKKLIMHSCDNPLCYNPKHLSQGDHKLNALDSVNKGRWATGRRSRKRSSIKNPYDFDALKLFIKGNTVKTEKDEWIYTGKVPKEGYPMIRVKNKKYVLPRLILANKLGKKYEDVKITRHLLPDGSRPSKIDLNPDHLVEGDRSQNSKDARSYSANSKLNYTQIIEIKRNLAEIEFIEVGDKTAFDELWAKKFNVQKGTIADIRLNKKWKDI